MILKSGSPFIPALLLSARHISMYNTVCCWWGCRIIAMLSDIIFAHILSVFLFITHEWLTGLQEDKVVSAVFFPFLGCIILPVTFERIHLNGFRQYVRMYVCMYVCVYVSLFLSAHYAYYGYNKGCISSSSKNSMALIKTISSCNYN